MPTTAAAQTAQSSAAEAGFRHALPAEHGRIHRTVTQPTDAMHTAMDANRETITVPEEDALTLPRARALTIMTAM